MMPWIVLALGGACGAMGRYALLKFLPYSEAGFPWPILLANCLGSIGIGFCYVLIADRAMLSEDWQAFISIGFLGAFTTFSTFALDAVLLWQHGQSALAAVYVLSSVLACMVCAAGSIWLAGRLF